MKKFFALLLALSMVFALCACGQAAPATEAAPAEAAPADAAPADAAPADAAPAIEPITMVLAHCEADGTTRDLAVEYFAEKVSEYSNGAITVEVYPGAQLGDMNECLQGLPMGTCNIYVDSVGALGAWTPLANIDAIPYMFRDADHFRAVTKSPVCDEILQAVGDDAGFKLVGAMNRGVRITTCTKKFTTPEEVAGIKLRVPTIQVYIDTWQHLGAITTPLSLTEVFTAIEQGTVDGQENPVDASYGYGLADCCDYLLLTNHVFSFDTMMFDQKYWNDLPDDVKAIIEKAVDETEDYRWDLVAEKQEEYIQKFADAGCEVVEVDVPAFIEYFKDFADTYYPDLKDWVVAIQEVQ